MTIIIRKSWGSKGYSKRKRGRRLVQEDGEKGKGEKREQGGEDVNGIET